MEWNQLCSAPDLVAGFVSGAVCRNVNRCWVVFDGSSSLCSSLSYINRMNKTLQKTIQDVLKFFLQTGRFSSCHSDVLGKEKCFFLTFHSCSSVLSVLTNQEWRALWCHRLYIVVTSECKVSSIDRIVTPTSAANDRNVCVHFSNVVAATHKIREHKTTIQSKMRSK